MKKPLMSVVILAYNEEKYLPKLFVALESQTFQDFEIIVVNNNSTDSTEIIAKMKANKVLCESKQGFSPARARGFNNARGEVIVKIDADTIPRPECLELILKAFENCKTISAVSGATLTAPIHTVQGKLSYTYYEVVLLFLRIIMGHHTLNGPIYALNKSVWLKIKPHNNDKKYHEDMDISCHCACYGKVVKIPGYLGITSPRRFKEEPLHIFRYIIKGINTYFLHHPSHKLHNVS